MRLRRLHVVQSKINVEVRRCGTSAVKRVFKAKRLWFERLRLHTTS